MNLDQVKKQIQDNAILGAALRDDSIRIIYKHPPEIDAQRLFRTWTIEVLIVDDSTYNGLINATLERLGWSTRRRGDKITCTRDEPITPAERAAMEAEDQVQVEQQQAAAASKREDLLIATLEAMQARIDDLEERLELMSLVKPKGEPGPAGQTGQAGAPGRDGKDLVATEARLQDLQDVSDEVPSQGNILMFQEATDSWELRYIPQSGGGGGGGGGGAGNGGECCFPEAPEDGQVYGRKGEDKTWVPIIDDGTGLRFWEEDEKGNFLPKLEVGQGTTIDGNLQEGLVLDANAEGGGYVVDGNSGHSRGQNIGSLEKPVGELYLMGNTLFMDGKPLALNGVGRLAFDGNQLGYGDGDVTEAPEDGQAYVRKDADWTLLEGSGGGVEVPTEVSEYPANYANIVVDLDTGLLVAVAPEDVIAPE